MLYVYSQEYMNCQIAETVYYKANATTNGFNYTCVAGAGKYHLSRGAEAGIGIGCAAFIFVVGFF